MTCATHTHTPNNKTNPPIHKKHTGKREVVFFGSLDKSVHAVDLNGGKPLWTTATDGWV